MNPNTEFDSNYVLRSLRVELAFEEHSSHRMIHTWHGEVEALTDMRFVQRRRGWSGKGIEASPRVSALANGRKLSARRHGPVYREGIDEFFLVDLGERVPAGARVSVHTESLYVDEAGTFEPFISAVALPTLERLTLGVVTGTPIIVSYSHDGLQAALESTPTASGLFESAHQIDSPTPGLHRIDWDWT